MTHNIGGGANNTSLGFNSLYDIVDGSQNVAIGSQAIGGTLGTTADNVGKAVSSEIINRLENKLDKLLRATNETKETVVAKNETELEIAKKQMDDEYDLRKDNLGKEYKEDFKKLEKLIIPLLIKLAKSPEAYIHWPNRAEVIEAQLKKIVQITRGK